jgi:hypothetical protein
MWLAMASLLSWFIGFFFMSTKEQSAAEHEFLKGYVCDGEDMQDVL